MYIMLSHNCAQIPAVEVYIGLHARVCATTRTLLIQSYMRSCTHTNMHVLMPSGGVVADWIGHSAFSAVVAGSNPSGSG